MAIIPSTLNTGLSAEQVMEAFNNALTHVPGTSEPAMDGTGSAGSADSFSRSDHVHPTDTSRASATAEAEDRAALVELVDSGAKNLGIPYSPDVSEGITVTVNADGSYTFVCTNVDSNKIIRVANISTHSTNTYIISGCSGGSSTTYMLGLYNPSATAVVYQYTEAVEQTRDISGYSLRVRIIAGYTGTFTIYPMICTEAAWKISQAYVPYRPSYQELYERVVALEQAQQ